MFFALAPCELCAILGSVKFVTVQTRFGWALDQELPRAYQVSDL